MSAVSGTSCPGCQPVPCRITAVGCISSDFVRIWEYHLLMTGSETSASRRALWIATIWCAIAVFEATETVLGMRAEGMIHNWSALFVTVLLSRLPWALMTPVVLRLGRRYPLKWIIWLMHAGLAILVNT